MQKYLSARKLAVAATILAGSYVKASVVRDVAEVFEVGRFEYAICRRATRSGIFLPQAFDKSLGCAGLVSWVELFLRSYKNLLLKQGKTKGGVKLWSVSKQDVGPAKPRDFEVAVRFSNGDIIRYEHAFRINGILHNLFLSESISGNFVAEVAFAGAPWRTAQSYSLVNSFARSLSNSVLEGEVTTSGSFGTMKLKGKTLWLGALIAVYKEDWGNDSRQDDISVAKLVFVGQVVGSPAGETHLPLRVYAIPADRDLLLEIIEKKAPSLSAEFKKAFSGENVNSRAVKQIAAAVQFLELLNLIPDGDRKNASIPIWKIIRLLRDGKFYGRKVAEIVRKETFTKNEQKGLNLAEALENGIIGDFLTPLLDFALFAAVEDSV